MTDYFWELAETRLRPLREDDVERYLTADLDSEAKRTLNYGVGLPRSLESQAEALPIDFKHAPCRLDFGVETVGVEFVGFVAISDINEQSGTFSTVSFILADHRRQGHAERAKELMLRYMFDERRFNKYNTACMASNSAIIAHLRKFGCKEEGRRRQSVFTRGRYYDQILFGLTKDEWEAWRDQKSTSSR
jgi:RimJ/RimL family protein N-acetyltransferase